MGDLIQFRGIRAVEQTEDSTDDQTVEPGDTPIGVLIKELSTPSRPGERTPFLPTDAPILLEHLLASRHATFWDEEACKRARRQILSLMTASLPDKRSYVADRLGGVDNRAAEAWIGRPLEAFTAAIRTAYEDRAAVDIRAEFLNDNRLAFLRASFLVCLFEPNAPAAPVVMPRAFVPHAVASNSTNPRPRR